MGGNAYFDNHRGFFEKQGCRVLDRSSFLPDEIHFANAWGVCDEDQPPEEIDEQRLARAIAYYQSASQLLKRAEQAAEHERTSSGEQRTVAVQKHVANAPAIARAPR